MKVNKLVGVVAGSDDEYHQDSIKEGLKIVSSIVESGRFDACLIEVATDQPWKLHKGTETVEMNKEKFHGVINEMRVKPEVVLIQARGKLAENGDLQQYFDNLSIPFSNSGYYQTKATFNKFECVNSLEAADLPVTSSVLFQQSQLPPEDDIRHQVAKMVGFPCFVKPNKGSKSYGISKLYESKDLLRAFETAFTFDDEVIVESAIDKGKEVICTVHDITMDEKLEAFPVTEVTPSGEYFVTRELSSGGADILTPTKTIRGEVVAEVVKIAKLAYRKLKLSGIASFDFIIKDELPFLLEVNPVPEFGPGSLVQKQVKLGLTMRWQRSIPKFYNTLVEHAIRTFPAIRMKDYKKEEKSEKKENTDEEKA